MGRTKEWSEGNAEFGRRYSALFNTLFEGSGKSVREIAKEAGVSNATVYNYRSGTSPSMYEGLKLLKALGVDSLTIGELVP